MRRAGGWTVELPLAGRQVVVAGGGAPALGRIVALRGADAAVVVVAPAVLPSVVDLADRGLLEWRRRELRPADLDAAWLVVAATGDEAADAAIHELADARRIFCVPGSPAAARSGVPRRLGLGGRVVLVGGGPGDPGLLTITGLRAVQEADVVVTDRLAPLPVLDQVRRGTEIVDVSKSPGGAGTSQEEINELLIAHARAGRTVVRLKGGDGFVFGRGAEEWQACMAAGIDVQIVPGLTSATAVPALAGIPLTHRALNQGFSVITGHVPPGDPRSMLDYAALARSNLAIVVLMGVSTLGAITAELIRHGMEPATPAATIADGTLSSQRVVRAPLADIAAATAARAIGPPAITVIGSVAGFEPDSH